jgi:ligand-binding SRPBCC domain-containing protein
MRIYTLEQVNLVPCPLDQAFAFFGNPYNLNKITPPWLDFSILYAPQEIYRGCILYYRLKLHGVPITWVTQIVEWDPPRRFVDIQLIGPYRLWHHLHEFEPGENGTLIRDVVNYALPLGWLGRLAHRLFVRRDLERIFAYRQEMLGQLLGGTNPVR